MDIRGENYVRLVRLLMIRIMSCKPFLSSLCGFVLRSLDAG